MAIRNQPINLNQLNVVSFETNFLRMPNINYFCQRVNLPGISLANTIQSTPFANIPIEGDVLEFEDLNITFIVDEDLKNYLELYNWLIALGFPERYAQYDNEAGKAIKSDCNIIIHTNKSNPNYSIVFKDVFPVSLGVVNFDTNNTDLEPVVVDATFKYTGIFDVNKLV
tara:strand:+ start:1763 stop:2269 length:507 start_codon:yes stop_codon:yes gene_type:complete